MAFKNKKRANEVYLKPGESQPIPGELGKKYIWATPLREYWWRAISDCCRARIQRDIFEEALADEETGIIPEEKVNVPTCSKCHLPCGKQWTTKSKLIPCLSREDDQLWHSMDDAR